MNIQEQQYLDLLTKLLEAPVKTDRTGTGTQAVFGHQMRFDLTQGFPLLTTKKVHFKSIVVELLWFLKGDTNIKYLLEHGCTIWTEWRYKEYKKYCEDNGYNLCNMETFEHQIVHDSSFAEMWGDIGKGYGHQWRNFGQVYVGDLDTGVGAVLAQQVESELPGRDGFDQISWLINEIKTNPDSRRLIVSGWNPHEVNQVDLPPCHTLFQFFVQDMSLEERKRWVDNNYTDGGLQAIVDHHKSKSKEDREQWSEVDFEKVCDFAYAPKAKLSCQLYQRSADTFLGVPFNIASYALLTHLIAHECGLGVGDFVWTGGDVHLYSNHIEQAKLQLTRKPYPFPQLKLDLQGKSIFDLEPSQISIENYQHHDVIKAPVAV